MPIDNEHTTYTVRVVILGTVKGRRGVAVDAPRGRWNELRLPLAQVRVSPAAVTPSASSNPRLCMTVGASLSVISVE